MIYLGQPEGFGGNTYALIRDFLNSFEKLDWHYQSPSSFFCYLAVNPENRKLAKTISDKFLKLRECKNEIVDVRIGLGEGNVLGEFNRKGELNPSSIPLGEAVSKSIKSAF